MKRRMSKEEITALTVCTLGKQNKERMFTTTLATKLIVYTTPKYTQCVTVRYSDVPDEKLQ